MSFFLYTCLWLAGSISTVYAFVHPGHLSTMADLDIVKNNQAIEPWKSALAALKACPSGSLTYVMKGPFPHVWREAGHITGWAEFGKDGTAAYVQAVLWYVTGNATYATNSKNIINTWSSTLVSLEGHDVKLLAAGHGPLWAQAGEILRYTNAGWAAADITRCENMLTNIFVPIMKDYAVSDGANWTTECIYSNMAIAVFTNNQALFDGAWAKFIDPSGCPNDGSVLRNIAYNGQNVESGRDQVHSWSSYEALTAAAEVAYHQGKDPYRIGSNRLLTGAEYWCKYNLGFTVPFDTSIYRCRPGFGPWPVISSTSRGVPTSQGATCNMMYRAYRRMGLEATYTKQMAAAMGNTLCPPAPRNGWTARFITDALLFNLPPSEPPPVITSPTTASGNVGAAFSYSITATHSPTNFKATGLPAGLSIDTVTGVISGTPTTGGTYSVALSATNASGMGTATLTFTVINAAVAAPTFNPAAGAYSSAQSITISSATSGASIRYTIDGSAPTSTTGTVYGTPVSISASATLKAIAYKSGLSNSSVSSAVYTIQAGGITIKLEAESMPKTSIGCTPGAISDTHSSGGAWLGSNSTAIGNSMTMTTPSIVAGTYKLVLAYKAAPTRGNYTIKIDGAQVGGVLDQYSAAVSYPSVTVGNVTFGSTGTHTITLTVTGKNASSTGYRLTADAFTFTAQ